MKIILLSILFCIACTFISNAQAPTIQWQRSLGGSYSETGLSAGGHQTPDGGYIACGWSYSNDGDVTGHHGTASETDIWVVKLDSSGIIDWQQSYGGTLSEYAGEIKSTSDGGYIFCGQTFSSNGDVTGNHSTGDVWVVKLDVTGVIQWQYCYGGPGEDIAISVVETNSGGFVLAGTALANGGDVSGLHGNQDIWLLKLSSSGTLDWQKCLGGSDDELTNRNNIIFTADGGIVLYGTTYSNNGDVSMNNGGGDLWLVKTDSLGNVLWNKSFGGTGRDDAFCLTATSDGGYLVSGDTYSPVSGDVTLRYNVAGPDPDCWMVKTDSLGNKSWVKTLGGSSMESATATSATSDGGYLLLGLSGSNDFDVSGNHGNFDFWLAKTDGVGTLQWQRSYGGTEYEFANDMYVTNDGGILLFGASGSNDGDVSGHHGVTGFINHDMWIVKLNPFVTSIEENNSNISDLNLFPNPVSSSASISFSLNETKTVSIKIYDITGREIKTLVNEKLNAGEHQIAWNITNQNNQPVDAGIYFVIINEGDNIVSKKITVIK